MKLHLRILAYTPASVADVRTGLHGWIDLWVDEALLIRGVALRRTRAGRMTLSFPATRDRRGRQRTSVRPVDSTARIAIELAVIGMLREMGAIAS